MTRRDYIRIAAALRRVESDVQTYAPRHGGSKAEQSAYSMGQSVAWYACVVNIADGLAADNPRFDRQRFYDACDPLNDGS